MDAIITGYRIRKKRKSLGKAQSEIAHSVGISVSYFNMIESGKRRVAGQLLSNIARSLGVDVDQLLGQQEARLATSLSEILSDLRAQGWQGNLDEQATPIAKLSAEYPGWVDVILHLHDQSTTIRQLGERLHNHSSIEKQLNDTGYQILQHLTTLSSAAGILEHSADLSSDARLRFGRIVQRETKTLEAVSREHFDRLKQLGRSDNTQNVRHNLDVLLHQHLNHFPELEELARKTKKGFHKYGHNHSNIFKTALAWLEKQHHQDIIATTLSYANDKPFVFQNSLRTYFHHYTAAALLMPHDIFLEDAYNKGYDVDALAHQYKVSFEQICHRLTSLKKTDSRAISFAFMKVDAGGNVIKSYSLANFYIPISGTICPRWPIFSGPLDSMKTATHKILHDSGEKFLAITHSIQTAPQAFEEIPSRRTLMLICNWADANQTVYAPYASSQRISCGTNCNICEISNCPDRLRNSLWGTDSRNQGSDTTSTDRELISANAGQGA